MTAGPTQIVSYPQRLCFRTTLEILTLLLTAGARFTTEGNILDTEPWDEVHAFAREMSKFYVTEANWRNAAYRHLRLIFHARKGPQALSVGMHTRSETSTRRVWFTVVPTVELCLYVPGARSRHCSSILIGEVCFSRSRFVGGLRGEGDRYVRLDQLFTR